MKKLILAASLLLVPALSHAQVPFDPNLVFSAGANCAVSTPVVGHRCQASFAATLPGLRITDNLFGGTLYAVNPGLNIHTLDVANGTASGLGVTLGGLEYHVKSGRFAVLAGVTRDITGDPKSTAVFVHVGGSITAPSVQKAARAAKKAAKAKAAGPQK